MIARMRARIAVLGLVALAGLTACSGGNTPVPTEIEIIQAGQQVVAKRTGRKAPQPVITRARLDALEFPAMEVVVEVTDSLSYVYGNLPLSTAVGGSVRLWRSEDGAQLVTRNGVLINTRGLGGDLIAAQPSLRGTAGPASGLHTLRVHDGNKGQATVSLRCDVVDMGAKTIEIIERNHSTRHVQQRCEGPGAPFEGVVVNDYWIDSARPIIWQSRQWAGPTVGYLSLRRLVE
jgi:hypothetical protein